ncbi:damage-control phosphatase ARMT1 family protein [Gorillibacterium sp. sgz5001074]|uniref:damage-control phosphatase ARMT1 family protein n=1 Tax=Gorillibacterium sp. sgz5001074 TaxID=3446695 RepID=UPI003F67D168
MNEVCKQCDRNQVQRVSAILSLDDKVQETLNQRVEEHLSKADMNKSNPEVMGEVWRIITETARNPDPYEEIKSYYNLEVMKIAPEIQDIIHSSPHRLEAALKTAVSANLIDFAAKHEFDLNLLMSKIRETTEGKLAIDDSTVLFAELRNARTLLYLGDNCGEIVLDKLFIQEIRSAFPELDVFYGVRGAPIVNDVTLVDARMVGMEEVAAVISNGDGSLGTVLARTSREFQDIYNRADVVIAKGQGNYESLQYSEKESLYFLFMAKCETVADPIHIPLMSIVCMKSKPVIILEMQGQAK